MKNETQQPKAASCPYCHEKLYVNETTQEDSIRIVCPLCHQNFHIDLTTMKTRKRVGDNETVLRYKLKCPRCGKHFLFYEAKTDEIISDICHKCGCVFRGNKLYGKSWESKKQPNPK